LALIGIAALWFITIFTLAFLAEILDGQEIVKDIAQERY
jgi:hypothetical protein